MSSMSSPSSTDRQSRLSDDLPNWRQISDDHWAWRGEQYCQLRLVQQIVLQDAEKFDAGVTPEAERFTLLAYTREQPTDEYVELGDPITATDARDQLLDRARRWMVFATTQTVEDLHDEVTAQSTTRCGCGQIISKTNRHNHLPVCPINPDAEIGKEAPDVQ